MEEKKYEAGKVEISSAEYRDLVTEAVTARHEASEMRSEKWRLEDTLKKTKEELELTRKRVLELENINEALRGARLYNTSSDLTRPTRLDEMICYASTSAGGDN